MKKSYFKLLILLVFMFLSLIFSALFYNLFEKSIIYCGYMIITFGISYLLVKFEPEDKKYGFDVFRKVFVYTITYLMLIYISGFMLGFTRSPYSLEISKLLPVLIPLVLIAIFEEMLRFNIIKKLENSKLFIIITTIIFIAIDIIGLVNLYSLKSGMEIYELIGSLIIPVISRNILFSYLAYRGYYKVNIIYRILITVLILFIPIYPNLGIYLESVLNIILPTLIYLSVNSMFCEQRLIFKKTIKYKNFFIMLPAIMFVSTVVILTSGLFKYYAVSVASGSMYPSIKVGDAVVVEKNTSSKLKKGDILVHKHDGKIILHRIVDVTVKKDETCYHTKGDANPQKDEYEICKNDMYGKVVFKVPFVGWPSVLIEKLNKK